MRAKIVRLLAMVRPWIAFSRAGVKAPRATSVGRPPILKIKGDVKIGARAHFRTVQLRPRIAVDRGATLTLGDDVFLNEGATIWASESVTIGDRVLMGNLSTIYDTNAHEVRPGEGVPHGSCRDRG
ncbi:hypothetical protein [Aeromicrobium sp. UC242_57]|uniref:hypothetical protein n=1 Tax=Aeromicrobium sp. UC242_57 TaxID=3374624 RepID=UPI0037A33C16